MKTLNLLAVILFLFSLVGCTLKQERVVTSDFQVDETSQYIDMLRDEADNLDNMLEVPLSSISPYEGLAKEAINKRLGVTVQEKSEIIYSSFDESNSILNFTWYYEKGNEVIESMDYYSVAFCNVDIEKGTGEVVYVRTMGEAARTRTNSFAEDAANEFARQYNNPVPQGSRLIVDMWEWDGNDRSVIFCWQPSNDIKTSGSMYTAGYDNVDIGFTMGDLSVLEVK